MTDWYKNFKDFILKIIKTLQSFLRLIAKKNRELKDKIIGIINYFESAQLAPEDIETIHKIVEDAIRES